LGFITILSYVFPASTTLMLMKTTVSMRAWLLSMDCVLSRMELGFTMPENSGRFPVIFADDELEPESPFFLFIGTAWTLSFPWMLPGSYLLAVPSSYFSFSHVRCLPRTSFTEINQVPQLTNCCALLCPPFFERFYACFSLVPFLQCSLRMLRSFRDFLRGFSSL